MGETKMQNFNYHTHTYRCGHADRQMQDEDYVKEFIQRNFKKIAFTDHCPQKNRIDTKPNSRMEYHQKDEYLQSIHQLQQKYYDTIQIETGFEVEYLPGEEKNLLELKRNVDKIILGQHFIYDKNKNLKRTRSENFNDEEMLTYAEYVCTAIKKEIPDMIAHPDLYMCNRKIFGKIEEQVARKICKTAQDYQIPLEINLGDIYEHRIGYEEEIQYPRREFWNIASEYVIKVLYGIDAHHKNQIATYDKSIAIANEIIGQEILSKLHFCENV